MLLRQLFGLPDKENIKKHQETSEDSEADEVELTPAFTNLLGLDPEACQYSSDEEEEPAAKRPWKGSERDAATSCKFRRPQEEWSRPAAPTMPKPPQPPKQEEAPLWVDTLSRDLQRTAYWLRELVSTIKEGQTMALDQNSNRLGVCGSNLAGLDTTLAATNQVSRELVDALHQNTRASHPATSSATSGTQPDLPSGIPIMPPPPVGLVLPTRPPLVSIPSLLQAVPPMRHCAPFSPPRAQGTWPAAPLPPRSQSSPLRRKRGPRKPNRRRFF